MDQLLNKMDSRQLNLVMIGVLLLTCGALGSYVVWPKVEVYRNLANTLEVVQNVVTHGYTIDHDIEALQQEVESLNYRLHGNIVDMSSNQLEAFIIGRIQNISWQHSVELRGVTPATGNQMQVFEEVLFNLEVAGDYFDLFSWLNAVRHELGMLVIKQFNITSIEGNSGEPLLSATFTIAFYREMHDA